MEEADRLILSAASAHRFVMISHVRRLLEMDDAGATGRLEGLEAEGLVRGERLTLRGARLFRITGSGLSAIESRLPPPGFTLVGFRHAIGVVWLWLAARGGAFGATERVVSAREMRGLDLAARRAPGEGRSAAFACTPMSADRSRAEDAVYPDLMLVLTEGRVAVHLELRPRAASELEGLLRGYAADPANRVALFMVDDRAIGTTIQATAGRLGLSGRVMVQRAATGRGAPTADPM